MDKRVYEAKVTELRPTESEIPFWLREVGIARGIWSKSCEQVPREASGPSEMRKIVVGDVSSTGAGVVKSDDRTHPLLRGFIITVENLGALFERYIKAKTRS